MERERPVSEKLAHFNLDLLVSLIFRLVTLIQLDTLSELRDCSLVLFLGKEGVPLILETDKLISEVEQIKFLAVLELLVDSSQSFSSLEIAKLKLSYLF